MSPDRTLSREESALEEFLQTTGETVAICLTEPFHPGSQMMSDRLRLFEARFTNFHVISLGLETHRAWAERYEAYGTPTVLLFHKGKLVRRLNGVMDENLIGNLVQSV